MLDILNMSDGNRQTIHNKLSQIMKRNEDIKIVVDDGKRLWRFMASVEPDIHTKGKYAFHGQGCHMLNVDVSRLWIPYGNDYILFDRHTRNELV